MLVPTDAAQTSRCQMCGSQLQGAVQLYWRATAANPKTQCNRLRPCIYEVMSLIMQRPTCVRICCRRRRSCTRGPLRPTPTTSAPGCSSACWSAAGGSQRPPGSASGAASRQRPTTPTCTRQAQLLAFGRQGQAVPGAAWAQAVICVAGRASRSHCTTLSRRSWMASLLCRIQSEASEQHSS